MRIAYPRTDYDTAISVANLERLDHRREHLCKKMYDQICQKDHKLNYLIPAERNVNYNLRRSRQLVADKTRVKRTDKSFINYCINKYNNNFIATFKLVKI